MPYLVMEYVDGETLHDRIKREGKLGARAAAEIVRQVAEGLGAAHRQDLVHRDVKSSNILLDRLNGRAKIADFGLARNFQLPPEITRHGEVSGTPDFMSREQILAPNSVDARTDVYGLGVVLYHALTGETPFRGTLLGVLKQVLDDEPLPPRRRDNAIPRAIETICLKCLEKHPRQRYASATVLAEDLQRYLDGKPIRARRPGILRQGGRWARRHSALAAGLAVGAVMISSSGLVVGSNRASHARAQARSAQWRQLAAEARAAAEHREAETQRREAQAQRREGMLHQMQHVRLTNQRDGWRDHAWGMARALAVAGRDPRLQFEAAACLAGLDAASRKSLPLPGTGLVFDPSGKHLLISGSSVAEGGPEQPVRIWNSRTDQLQSTEIQGDGVFGIRADGTPLFLTVPRAQPSIARLWDVSRSRLLQTIKSPVQGESKINARALAADGSVVAISAVGPDEKGTRAETSMIAVLEAGTGREIYRATTKRVTEIALAPDGTLLAAGHDNGEISVRSLPRGELTATLKADRNVMRCLTFGRDPVRHAGPRSRASGWVLASGDAGGAVIIWDLGLQIPRSICRGGKNSSGIFALAFSPDGTTLASGGRSSAIAWDAASGKFLLDMSGGNYVTALAFSSDGKWLTVGCVAAFGDPDRVVVWELEPGRGIDSLRGLVQSVWTSIFSPDGRLVAALSEDWHVGIWDRGARRLIHILEVTPGFYTDSAAMAFSPDGRRFAFSSGREASLWDVATGVQIKTWSLPKGLSDRLAFREPNRLLLFRAETETGKVGPPSEFPADTNSRVCRVRDLLSRESPNSLAEIRDCNLHVFNSDCSPDGRYYVIEGLGGSKDKPQRIANLYEGPTGTKLGPLPTRNPISWDNAFFNFDPTGTVLNYAYADHGGQMLLLEMPSRAPLREIHEGPTCLGPNAKRWLMGDRLTADQPSGLTLYEQNRDGPLVKFVLDSEIGRPRFSPDGLHLVWGNPNGAVTVVDLVEVNRRLNGLGLGW
jgi:WD40 repeat protein